MIKVILTIKGGVNEVEDYTLNKSFYYIYISNHKIKPMPAGYHKKKEKIQTVEEEKNALAIKVLSIKDKQLVHAMNVVFDDLTSGVKKTSKAQYNKEIEAAVKRVRSGKSVSNDQVMKDMDQW